MNEESEDRVVEHVVDKLEATPEQEEEHNPYEPRPHRRKMAYAAIFGILAISAGAFVRELWPANADLLTAIIYVLGAVVLGYMGAQIAPEVFKKK